MQAALDEAAKSEAKYYEYLPTQETLDENPEYYSTKTLLWVWALVHDEHVDGHDAFSTETKPIAKFALDYVNNYIGNDESSTAFTGNTVLSTIDCSTMNGRPSIKTPSKEFQEVSNTTLIHDVIDTISAD